MNPTRRILEGFGKTFKGETRWLSSKGRTKKLNANTINGELEPYERYLELTENLHRYGNLLQCKQMDSVNYSLF